MSPLIGFQMALFFLLAGFYTFNTRKQRSAFAPWSRESMRAASERSRFWTGIGIMLAGALMMIILLIAWMGWVDL